MEPSLFSRIISGEIPCHKVYEDEHTFAFMDIHPLLPGHVLVVPKKQVDHFDELDAFARNALMDSAQKLSILLRTVFKTKRTALLILGYDVPHVHLHLVPSDSSVPLAEAFNRIHIASQEEPDHATLAQNAEKIRTALSASEETK